MTVHFVYRSHYHGPTGLYRRTFDDATVLDWFVKRWQGRDYDDGAHELAKKLLGTHVYGFASLFQAILEHKLPPPKTHRQLVKLLNEHLYLEGELRAGPGLLQMLTDNDEIQLAYYFFDDAYLAKHRRHIAFLLQDDWRLPEDIAAGGFKASEPTTRVIKGEGAGATYIVINGFWDSCNLDDMGPAMRLDGGRLPELARYLAGSEELAEQQPDLKVIQSVLFPAGKKPEDPADPFLFTVRDDPADEAAWTAFGDWLAERGERSAGAFVLERGLEAFCRRGVEEYPDWKFDPKKSRVQVADHVAVCCRHVARWGKEDLYHQWYFFDDLWASAHPDLANALLRYARRWDVLTPR
jgi:uncharacterized protein (TIGR02996 family)